MKEGKFPDIAIVGSTGMVGSMFLRLLEDQFFLDSTIHLLASKRSAGKEIKFRSSRLIVQDLEQFDFSKVQLALFSAGSEVSRIYAPRAVSHGCTVIDNSSEYRYQEEVPLIVPEVNSQVIEDFIHPGIISNPNCSTIQMLVALKPIHDIYKIRRIDVTTMQAVSGTGQIASQELKDQQRAVVEKTEIISDVYPQQIANNVLPHCGDFQDNRYTHEEMKMVWETQKILDKEIHLTATCVRVPVYNGHSESLHIETKNNINENEVIELLKNSPGIDVFFGEDEDDYPTPLVNADGRNAVLVGRIRKDLWHENRLSLWVVSDNLLKGAALNSLQIAEVLSS